MQALVKWFTQFDVIKGIILVIAVLVSSWYDLRAEVRDVKKDHAYFKEVSAKNEQDRRDDNTRQRERDLAQDARTTESQTEIREALRDIRAEIRSLKR